MASTIALEAPATDNIFKRAASLIPGLLLLAAVGYAGRIIERSIATYGKTHHLTLPNIEYVLWAIIIGLRHRQHRRRRPNFSSPASPPTNSG